MKLSRALFPMLLFAAALPACGPEITIPPLAPGELRAGGDPQGPYRVAAGDTLRIGYSYHPEMHQEQVVRPDGKIRAAEAGEIVVGGLTTGEIAAELAARTADRLRDPEVVVTVVGYAPRKVYVAGEVGKPGPIEYRKGLTPLQAIAQAGGLRDTALIESVVLVRMAGREGRTLSRTLDLDPVLHDGVPEPLFLAPDDVVFVPRTGIAEANVWIDQHFTQIFPFFRGVSPGSINAGR